MSKARGLADLGKIMRQVEAGSLVMSCGLLNLKL